MLDKAQIKIGSMERHLTLLDIMLERNERWALEESRPEIRQAHAKIIDLLKQTRNADMALLDLYSKQTP